MPLQLAPMKLEDFSIVSTHQLFTNGDLATGPLSHLAYPASNQDEATQRLAYTMHQQRARFLHDPTAHFAKVVDTATDEIVALARWHFYPTGYVFPGKNWRDMDSVPAPGWSSSRGPPERFRPDVYDAIFVPTLEARKGWMPQGGPAWILLNLVTREAWRGKGAASMLIDWGTAQAEANGCPAYVEASVMGKPVYERRGFECVGEPLVYDGRQFGMKEEFVVHKMVRRPSTAGRVPMLRCWTRTNLWQRSLEVCFHCWA